MKAHYLEILHAKFEVSRSHRLGTLGDYPKLVPPPSPLPAPPPPVTPSLIKLAWGQLKTFCLSGYMRELS